jgi:carboxyl-terminal processing protease
MIKKNTHIFLLSLFVILFLFLLTPEKFLPWFSQKSQTDQSLKLLEYVAQLIRDFYVEEPSASKTMQGAFRGLIGPLDPLSSYLDPENVNKYRSLSSAELKEPGLVLFKKFGTYPVVIGVVESSPAEEAGIKIGDTISEMDGQPLLELSMTEANLTLKNNEEKPVSLTVLRTEASDEMSVERKSLNATPVSFSQQKGFSGILKVRQLFSPASSVFREKILPLLKSERETLIIDLRNCHEGELAEALQLANFFLHADEVGYLLDREGNKEILGCSAEAELPELPLVIWTNSATFGPAEALAGILQESRRAKIVGTKTPGLVAKQDFFPLEDGSALLLTSEIFYFPEGKEMWQKGISPDVKVEEQNPSSENYLQNSSQLLPEK